MVLKVGLFSLWCSALKVALIPGAVPLFEGDGLSSKYTVISRKVVEKSPCDNTEGYCGWFGVHCPSKKFARMVLETMDLRL